MMKRAAVLAAAALAVAGCASIATDECKSDAYQVGLRDGRIGAYSQADAYATRCSAFDRSRYTEGWRDGVAQRPRPVV